MRVIVVTGFELGWDNVVGVFLTEDMAAVEERFPTDEYLVRVHDISEVEEYE